MIELSQTRVIPNTLLELLTGLLVGGLGGVVLIWTNTPPGALSVLAVGLSFVFGLLTVVADRFGPVGRIFERGRWLLIGVAVLLLLAAAQGVFSLSQWLGLTLGFSGGIVIGTVGVGTKQLVAR